MTSAMSRQAAMDAVAQQLAWKASQVAVCSQDLARSLLGGIGGHQSSSTIMKGSCF